MEYLSAIFQSTDEMETCMPVLWHGCEASLGREDPTRTPEDRDPHGLWGLVGFSPTGGAVELAPTEDPGCTSFSPKIHNHTLRTQNYICKWMNLRHSIIVVTSIYHKFRSIAPTGSYRYQRSRGDMGCGSYQGRYGQRSSPRTLGQTEDTYISLLF